ncbi:1-hydroxycarotenoid 3,4-desaturase CrtD [Aestuariibius insulae]|uniref:1-hydroxycarotenoid 3,4-desaturase CrtD n=1 Tax=Aestuariibius insulae TaxID=2058287 RepID=UPI00345E258B
MAAQHPRTIVIGAGIGGLATALRLSHAGHAVQVFERHAAPGGKIRTVPSVAGPVDAGPTVVTLKRIFEQLFDDVGERLSDHLTLRAAPVIARHFWKNGTTFDLCADPEATMAEVERAFGADAAGDYDRFRRRASALFQAFEPSMIETAAPSLTTLILQTLGRPSVLRQMTPFSSLETSLQQQFREPKLAQLFGRYATYVGGLPSRVPAILSLISDAEAQGVWSIDGGIHQLPLALEKLAEDRGATFHYNADVTAILAEDGHVAGIICNGDRVLADAVVFNGDPLALADGALGAEVTSLVSKRANAARSLSAQVMAFASRLPADGPKLSHHNVFFGDDSKTEFGPLERGGLPEKPTLYVCAQDRGGDAAPTDAERFEIIMNAPPITVCEGQPECHHMILKELKDFGLTFLDEPKADSLTTPKIFDSLFPHSGGSLYGRSPHGMMAAFRRPTAKTALKGFYLAGGGVHPGAGIPMATLSGRHAAEAILKDRISTSMSRPADTPGGMSTASATMERAPSRSSAS